MTFLLVEGLPHLTMSQTIRIEQHAFTLLLAAAFAVLLAFTVSGIAKAHGPSLHSAHQMHAEHGRGAPNSEQHSEHSGHAEHNHGWDCSMHVGCDCSGLSFCNVQASGAALFASPSRAQMVVVLPDRQIDLYPPLQERPPGGGYLVTPRSMPPPHQGWRTRLYANIPRLRI